MATSVQPSLPASQMQLILKAMADPRRFEILSILRHRKEAAACISMRGCIGISPATFSHHMKELETAGLIHVVREGKFASYTLRRDVLRSFLRQLRLELD